MRHGPEAGDHADDDETHRRGRHTGQGLQQSPHGRAGGPTNDHAGAEHAAGTAGTDGQGRREDLREGDGQDDDHRHLDEHVGVHLLLHVAVAGAQRLGQQQAEQSDAQATHGRLEPARQSQLGEQVGAFVEHHRVEPTHEAGSQPQEDEPDELHWFGELHARQGAEDRAEPVDGSEGHVGDDRADERGHHRVGLHVVAVEQLRAEQGAAQRGTEDRPDARGHGC